MVDKLREFSAQAYSKSSGPFNGGRSNVSYQDRANRYEGLYSTSVDEYIAKLSPMDAQGQLLIKTLQEQKAKQKALGGMTAIDAIKNLSIGTNIGSTAIADTLYKGFSGSGFNRDSQGYFSFGSVGAAFKDMAAHEKDVNYYKGTNRPLTADALNKARNFAVNQNAAVIQTASLKNELDNNKNLTAEGLASGMQTASAAIKQMKSDLAAIEAIQDKLPKEERQRLEIAKALAAKAELTQIAVEKEANQVMGILQTRDLIAKTFQKIGRAHV